MVESPKLVLKDPKNFNEYDFQIELYLNMKGVTYTDEAKSVLQSIEWYVPEQPGLSIYYVLDLQPYLQVKGTDKQKVDDLVMAIKKKGLI